jgi:hypothetical protein
MLAIGASLSCSSPLAGLFEKARETPTTQRGGGSDLSEPIHGHLYARFMDDNSIMAAQELAGNCVVPDIGSVLFSLPSALDLTGR